MNPTDPLPPPTPSGAAPEKGRPAAVPYPSDSPVPPSQLTPEEQMALFEKELKENDWGHQPC